MKTAISFTVEQVLDIEDSTSLSFHELCVAVKKLVRTCKMLFDMSLSCTFKIVVNIRASCAANVLHFANQMCSLVPKHNIFAPSTEC
jgi:hypothetical protein